MEGTKREKVATKFEYNNSVDVRPPKANRVDMYVCTALNVKYKMCIPCFIVLHFIVLHKYYIFYKLKFCGNPVSSKSISAIFFKSICSLRLCVTFW